jgi:hypothetical protein
MLNLDYKKTESDTMPDEIDTMSSPTTVYLRRNIHTEERQDIEAETTRTVYVYDEATIPRDEYDAYLSGKTQADIEYLYMMGGLDYE